jgi:hypothetical protein
MWTISVFITNLSENEGWKSGTGETQQMTLNMVACTILSGVVDSVQEVVRDAIMWTTHATPYPSITFWVPDEFKARALELTASKMNTRIVIHGPEVPA